MSPAASGTPDELRAYHPSQLALNLGHAPAHEDPR
jgi:hypothetical protein